MSIEKVDYEEKPEQGTFFHPLSGLLLLSIDWLLFTSTILSATSLFFVFSLIGVLMSVCSISLIQKFVSKNTWLSSISKGLLAGFLVGMPLPVAGTALSSVILFSSGLNKWKSRIPKIKELNK